jgi:hypothetical protein
VTLKEVASVIDDINEWENPHRPGEFVYYVTAFFTDGDVGSAGRKDLDAAVEVRGLLQETIGEELDFTLEPKKPTKSGKAAWKILGFGTPGGAATYTAPGVQGGGAPSVSGGTRSRPPEPSSEQASIRASVALKAAADFVGHDGTYGDVLRVAEHFDAWLLEKTSDASSEYEGGGLGTVPPASSKAPAGASEDSSDPAGVREPVEVGSESGGGVETMGKEAAPPPHEHDWQPHKNLRGWLSCECGENRKKYAP